MGYPPRQLWALAVSGVLTELNSAHHHELGGWGLNEHTRNWCRNTLRDFYGIESAEEHAEMIEQLWKGEQMAWDMGRLVAVMGWGVWAEYVTEEVAWPRMLMAAYRVQQTYRSWREFGDAYEASRLAWAKGKPHDATAKALARLHDDPRSPWRTLDWNLDLGVVVHAPARARYKRSTCAHCGGHKARPSLTAYVYCDHCGELCDFDFLRACDNATPPGPAYEALRAQVAPALEAARGRGDRAAYQQVQEQLFDAFVAACPKSVSPRVGDPAYRRAYVAYMAEAATLAAFDEQAAQLDATMRDTMQRVQFVAIGGAHKVVPPTFVPLLEAVLARLARTDALYRETGTYLRHPDGAPAELQQRIDASLFVQGWLPYLDEGGAQRLLGRMRLDGEYTTAEPGPATKMPCHRCGAGLAVVAGARRVVCEHCGHRLELARAAG